MKALKIILPLCLVAILGAGAWLYSCVNGGFNISEDSTVLYLDSNDTEASVRQKLINLGANPTGVDILMWRNDYKVSTGRYIIRHDDRLKFVMRRLKLHLQDAVRLVVPSVRLVSDLPARLAPQLMATEEELTAALTDTGLMAELSYDAATFPSMIIPNTYEVYWDIAPRQLVERLHREHEAFWNSERRGKAAAMALSPLSVSTLASIVAEETANNAEKPTVAGLYFNRLLRGMKLEADPTVKFAVGDFTLRRVLFKHLEVESPYNTYKVTGLPPGPIRIPDIVDIDAVLNYAHHDYIYMCAKEDFSGTHNFARTLSEHQANARRYQAALSRRGIR